jgi:hypothetical protein
MQCENEVKRRIDVMPSESKPFDPGEHLTVVKGGKQYLEVKWRVVWFREKYPLWTIETELIHFRMPDDSGKGGYAVFKASIKDEMGRVISTGTGNESSSGWADFIDKAETSAVGRALAFFTYGTQFAPEIEAGERESKQSAKGGKCANSKCGAKITANQVEYSARNYGKPLCPPCQKKEKDTQLHKIEELLERKFGNENHLPWLDERYGTTQIRKLPCAKLLGIVKDLEAMPDFES